MSASLVLSIADGQSDQVLVLLIGEMSQHFPQLEYLLALFMAATVAAIMSTIDSALLALNSFITKDLAQPLFPTTSQQTLVATSKKLSWLLMLGLAAIASVLPQNIWAILIVKIEAMAQVFPALLLGLTCPTIQAKPILLGLLLGVFVTVWLKFFAPFDLHGIHAGTWGLLTNFAFVWLLHLHQNGGRLLFIKK